MSLRATLPILFLCASATLRAGGSTDLLARGFSQMQAGDCPAAATTLEPFLTGKTASQASAYRLLSDCYSKTKQPGKALAVLRDGLKSSPGSPILQRSLGELLFRQDSSNPEAGALLQKSAEALPQDPESRHFYAQWAYLNNREGVCVEQEKQALALTGSNEPALLQMYTLKALCEDKLDRAEAAGGDFRESNAINMKLAPFDPATAFQYVDFLNRRAKEAEAQKIVDEILARAPQFGPAHLEKAKFFSREGQREKAIDEGQLAIAGEGNDKNGVRAAHVLLARLYFALGRKQQAEEQQEWVSAHSAE